MPNLIIFEEKEVLAQGLNREKKPAVEKIKEYFFDDEFERLQELQEIEHSFLTTEVSLLYPGCGTDILTPLLYLEKITPKLHHITFHCVDISDSFQIMKTILHDVGISFADGGEGENRGIQFYWQHMLVTLQFHTQNIARFLHDCPNYHIYFEKCFRIMKDRMPEYEQVVFDRLAANGLVISDSGFREVGLEEIRVNSQLSAYNEMMVGRKK